MVNVHNYDSLSNGHKGRSNSDRLKPLSMNQLTPEQALRAALEVDPADLEKEKKREKSKKRRSRKKKK